jgi:FKBP-type peptidyl-prolyl cis-trans isomerase FkpA
MLRNFLCAVVTLVLLSGCLKKESGCPYSNTNIVAPESEQKVITDYLAANNLTATKHSSGLYYQIVQQGSGSTPQLCSQVTANYLGKLTNGNVFDQQNNAVFVLGPLIEGWNKGLPLIQEGGQIRLYIPPSLGYGPAPQERNGVVVIPAYSMLIFDITLLNVE